MTTWTNQRLAEERRRTDAALAHEERDLVGRGIPWPCAAAGLVAVGLVVWGLWHG